MFENYLGSGCWKYFPQKVFNDVKRDHGQAFDHYGNRRKDLKVQIGIQMCWEVLKPYGDSDSFGKVFLMYGTGADGNAKFACLYDFLYQDIIIKLFSLIKFMKRETAMTVKPSFDYGFGLAEDRDLSLPLAPFHNNKNRVSHRVCYRLRLVLVLGF